MLTIYSLVSIYLYICTSLSQIQATNQQLQTDNLYGNKGFSPCKHHTDATGLDKYILICDEVASRHFGDSLPSIHSNGIVLSQIRILDKQRVQICPNGAFASVHPELQVLRVTGAQLVEWNPGCFEGLRELQELYIENHPDTKQGKSGARDLFDELNRLTHLIKLHLIHVDLTEGIPDGAFSQWSGKLILIHLAHNRLRVISDDAFNSTSPSSLRQLRLEHQLTGYSLLVNAPKWARRFEHLDTISLTGSPLFSEPGIAAQRIILDFGETVNRVLRTLILNQCSITRLSGQLQANGLIVTEELTTTLHHLSLNENRFEVVHPNGSSLDGLKTMKNLRVLRLERNQNALHTIPMWMGSNTSELRNLRELHLSESGLVYLPALAFPSNINLLQLSANSLRYVDPRWANNLAQLNELQMNYVRLHQVDIGGIPGDWVTGFGSLTGQLRVLSLIGCQLDSDSLGEVDQSEENEKQTSWVGSQLRLGLGRFKLLDTLVLNHNNLTHIEPGLFRNLTTLRRLALVGNRLTNVGALKTDHESMDEITPPIPHLIRLDLRYNQLTRFDRCAHALGFSVPLEELLPTSPLRGLTNDALGDVRIGGLSLRGNRFECDCRLVWLRYYMSDLDMRMTSTYDSIPANYEIHRREALDFKCSGPELWKSRSFLSLTIENLYAVDHVECRYQNHINGSAQIPKSPFKPCREFSNELLSEQMPAMGSRMFRFKQNHRGPENHTERDDLFNDEDDIIGLSIEALVMVIVAGVFCACFIVVSSIVITWLSLRLRRRERQLAKSGYLGVNHVLTNDGGRQSTPYKNSFNGRRGGNGLYYCCTYSRQRTQSSAGTLMKEDIAGHHSRRSIASGYRSSESCLGPTASLNSIDGQSIYDEPGDSYYSQLSDVNWTNRSVGTSNFGRNRGRRPRLQRSAKRVATPETPFESDSEPCVPVESTWHHRVKQSVSMSQMNTINPMVNVMKTTPSVHSLEQELKPRPPEVPLPPVPAQRKTRSTADLRLTPIPRTSEVESPHHRHATMMSEPAWPPIRSRQHIPGQEYQLTSDEYRSILPWHSQTNTRNRGWKSSARSSGGLTLSGVGGAFFRNRLTKSAGAKPKPSHDKRSDSVNTGLEQNRNRLQHSFDWLRRTTRATVKKRKAAVKGQPTGLETGRHATATRTNLNPMQGPDLPKPPLNTSDREQDSTVAVFEIPQEYIDYLAMSPEPRNLDHNLTMKMVESTRPSIDEMNRLEGRHERINGGTILRRTHINQSETDPVLANRPAKPQQPLRLSGNLYALSMAYEYAQTGSRRCADVDPTNGSTELMVTSPLSSQSSVAPAETIATTPTTRSKSPPSISTTASISENALFTRAPPPIGPKPRDIDRVKLGLGKVNTPARNT